jgi:hypothetical protein
LAIGVCLLSPKLTIPVIRFFRVNDPYRLVVAGLLLVAVRLFYGLYGMPLSAPEFKWLLLGDWLGEGLPMYTHTFDYTPPLSAFVYSALDWLFGRSRTVHWIFSTLLVIFQASYFNRILLRNKVFDENTYIPAFLYVVFMTATFDFFSLSPHLMSLTFIILALDHLVRKMDKMSADELYLFPGIYLGIGALFYMPAIAVFMVFLIALIVISNTEMRRVFLFSFGWLLVMGIAILVLYFQGTLQEAASVYFIELFRDKTYFVDYRELGYITALPGFIFLVAVLNTLSKRESNLHVMVQQVMLLLFGMAVGVMLASGTLGGQELLFFVPVFTFFVTNYILSLKKRIWKFLIPNVLVLGSLLVPFVWLSTGWFLDDLTVEKPKQQMDKSVMIIGKPEPIYLEGKMRSPFLDGNIGKMRLNDLDYYQKSQVFLEIFQKVKPDMVYDRLGAMKKIMFRFPEIETAYQEIEPGVFKRVNN